MITKSLFSFFQECQVARIRYYPVIKYLHSKPRDARLQVDATPQVNHDSNLISLKAFHETSQVITPLNKTMAFRKLQHSVQWDPTSIFSTRGDRFAAILLNHSLDDKTDQDKRTFASIWSKAVFKVGVDGGCNTLKELMKETNSIDVRSNNWIPNPDVISGDFDSIDPKVVEEFRRDGVNVVHTPDQDETDFTKAVNLVVEQRDIDSRSFEYIVAFGGSTGRVDQFLSNIHTLYKFVDVIPIFLVDVSHSISFVLSNLTKHIVIPPPEPERSWCSLVPLMEASSLTTNGLKWNLDGDTLRFGTFISTSNEFDSESKQVLVETSKPILWSMKC